MIIKCGLRFAVCVLYIFVSELTLYVHAPANCGNTALAELTTSWQSCYRCRRRRRRRCCCCCCCCCCFCFSPQKRQTHLKPLIAASPSVSSYVLLYATVLPLCPITGLGSGGASLFLAKKLLCLDFTQVLVRQTSNPQIILRIKSSQAIGIISINTRMVFHAKQMELKNTKRSGPVQKS